MTSHLRTGGKAGGVYATACPSDAHRMLRAETTVERLSKKIPDRTRSKINGAAATTRGWSVKKILLDWNKLESKAQGWGLTTTKGHGRELLKTRSGWPRKKNISSQGHTGLESHGRGSEVPEARVGLLVSGERTKLNARKKTVEKIRGVQLEQRRTHRCVPEGETHKKLGLILGGCLFRQLSRLTVLTASQKTRPITDRSKGTKG